MTDFTSLDAAVTNLVNVVEAMKAAEAVVAAPTVEVPVVSEEAPAAEVAVETPSEPTV